MAVKVRPVSSMPVVADGSYPGKITSVENKTEPNKYKNNEPHEVFYLEITIKTPDEPVKLRKRIPYVASWSEKSTMFKLLRDLECLPEPGEGFDFDDLLGMNVQVSVINNQHEGKIYPNVDQMRPRVTKKEVRRLERKVEKKPENDADFDFGDIIDEVGDDGDNGDDDVEVEDED